MYKFNHMRRHESAVAWSDERNALVEAQFPNKEDAEALMHKMIQQEAELGIDEGLHIFVAPVKRIGALA